MTKSEYAALLAECNFRDPQQVSELVLSTHTNVMINDDVQERAIANSGSAYNYFGDFFGKDVWQDGAGMDEVREFYADPFIPFSFSHFVRQSAICDPNFANECNRDRCQVPEGGRGTLPPFVFYKWGFETPRDCIANIRSIRQFKYWARKILRGRELMDEQVMNAFYTMAAIHTTGNKVTMQGVRDANGNLMLAPSNNPRNPVRGGLYNYQEERFPAPYNLEDMVPLTVDTLMGLSRFWDSFPVNNWVATGPRGEKIWEFWTPDDWYYTEGVRDPDFMEKLKYTLPATLFAGHRLQGGEREIISNWAARTVPFLPRFAPTAEGEIVPVDTHVGVDIEVGQEYVGSADFENAPFGIAMIPSPNQGTILTRPTLTESGAGFPIMPISSDSGWRIRNDYDPVCNKDLNQPYSQRDYEMGIRMDDPRAALAFLFRRRKFASRPINECDLAPIFNVIPNVLDCPITTIGCQDGKRRESNNIIDTDGYTYVSCTTIACGNTAVAPFHYVVKIDRVAGQPDFNSLGCACGSAVVLFVHDENGDYARQITGVYKSDIVAFPDAKFFIETTEALAEGECIRGISCADETPDAGNVIDAIDTGIPLEVAFILDSPLSCEETEAVTVTYKDAAGVVLGTVAGTLSEVDHSRFYYKVLSTNPAFKADDVFAGQASVDVTCA